MKPMFVVLHISGDYFGHGEMIPFADRAEKFTKERVQKQFGHRGDVRIAEWQEVNWVPGGGYDGSPVAGVVRLAEVAA